MGPPRQGRRPAAWCPLAELLLWGAPPPRTSCSVWFFSFYVSAIVNTCMTEASSLLGVSHGSFKQPHSYKLLCREQGSFIPSPRKGPPQSFPFWAKQLVRRSEVCSAECLLHPSYLKQDTQNWLHDLGLRQETEAGTRRGE